MPDSKILRFILLGSSLIFSSCRAATGAASHELGDDIFRFWPLILKACRGGFLDFVSLFPWIADVIIFTVALIFAFRTTIDLGMSKNIQRSVLVIASLCLGLVASHFSRDLLEERRITKGLTISSVLLHTPTVAPRAPSMPVTPTAEDTGSLKIWNEANTKPVFPWPKVNLNPCPACRGTGVTQKRNPLDPALKCPECSGTGRNKTHSEYFKD